MSVNSRSLRGSGGGYKGRGGKGAKLIDEKIFGTRTGVLSGR